MTWNPFNRNMVTVTPLPPVNPSARTPGYNGNYTRRILPGGGVPGPLPVVKRVPAAAPAPAAPAPAPAAPPQPGLLGQPGITDGLLAASGAMGKFAGPSRTPVSLGAAIGPTLQAFVQGQRQGEEYEIAKAARDAKAAALAAITQKHGPGAALAPEKYIEEEILQERMKGLAAQPGDGSLTPDQARMMQAARATGDPKVVASTMEKIQSARVSQGNQLRKEFSSIQDASGKLIGNANRAQQLLARINSGTFDPISDIEVVYRFISSMDPDSVVREGEIALTNSGQSLAASVALQLQRITSKEDAVRLYKDGTVKAMLQTMIEIGKDADAQMGRNIQAYEYMADQQGIDRRTVIMPHSRAKGGAPSKPISGRQAAAKAFASGGTGS